MWNCGSFPSQSLKDAGGESGCQIFFFWKPEILRFYYLFPIKVCLVLIDIMDGYFLPFSINVTSLLNPRHCFVMNLVLSSSCVVSKHMGWFFVFYFFIYFPKIFQVL